jgi:hypothetical protein
LVPIFHEESFAWVVRGGKALNGVGRRTELEGRQEVEERGTKIHAAQAGGARALDGWLLSAMKGDAATFPQ